MIYGYIIVKDTAFTWDITFEAKPVEEDVPSCLFLSSGVSCDKMYVCNEGVCVKEVSDHVDG